MIDPIVKKRLGALADRTVQQMRNVIMRSGKFNTGELSRSISWKFTADGIEIIVGAKYGKYVISGRYPGDVKIYSGTNDWPKGILSWLNTPHGVRAYANMRRRWKTLTKEQATFVIIRSIKKKGIKPLDFYNPAMNRLLNVDLYHLLSADYAHAYEHELQKTLKNKL